MVFFFFQLTTGDSRKSYDIQKKNAQGINKWPILSWHILKWEEKNNNNNTFVLFVLHRNIAISYINIDQKYKEKVIVRHNSTIVRPLCWLFNKTNQKQ